MEIVDLRETRDQGLLEQAYRELYLLCFTDPNEQEDLEQYRQRLFEPQLPIPQPVTHFLVAGENLSDPTKRIIHGLQIFELYRESSCGLLTYTAVAASARKKGLARILVRKAIDILSNECIGPDGLRAVFAETHDPTLIEPAADSMSPTARIEVMRRLGAKRVPVRYVQPQLRPGDGRSHKLLLIAFPIIPNETLRISGPALLDFLDEFYRALGVPVPSQDGDFLTTKSDVEAAERNAVHPEVARRTLDLGLEHAPLFIAERVPVRRGGWSLLAWWALAIGWFVAFPYAVQILEKLFPPAPHPDHFTHWTRWDYFYYLVVHFVDFILTVIRGAVAFVILGWSYRTPFLFLVYSTFPDDEPLRPQWSWSVLLSPFAALRRLIEMLFYYKGMVSLSSVRRFLYVATHPVFSRKVFNLRPERIFRKLQVYFETELFRPQAAGETRGAYGEAVAALYCHNMSQVDRGILPVAKCRTCFDVFGANGKKIERYFNAQVRVHRDPRFFTRIEFENGYLAPAYLVSGLLSEFDEDWTKIVGAYPEKMKRLTDGTDPIAALPDLRKLQSFIWDCWVQWGPSVPISDSASWRSGEVALQYGYGDENNSLPIRLNRTSSDAMPDEEMLPAATHTSRDAWLGYRFANWERRIGELLDGGLEREARAWPVKVSGQLRWLMRKERNSRFCSAQRTTKREDDGWLVLDADSIGADPDRPKFYSAYVWVVIAICCESPDSSGSRGFQLIETDPMDQWRCLIPFFQHGNIAEPSVYDSIKRELAEKTISILMIELQRAESAGVDWLNFAFIASYDNNGDRGNAIYPSQSSFGSIRDYMVDALRNRVSRDPVLKPLAAKIKCEADAVIELTACELPHVVRTYLNHIEEVTV